MSFVYRGALATPYAALPAVVIPNKLIRRTIDNTLWMGTGTVWVQASGVAEIVTFDVACNAAVVVQNWLYMDDAADQAELACAGQGAALTPAAEYVCVAKPAAAIATVIQIGEVAGLFPGLDPGDQYFLSFTPGAMTTVLPTWAGGFGASQRVGVVSDVADEFVVDLGERHLLSP